MAEAVIMPRQGQSVESCLVTTVNIKKGDKINIGDVLFSYETDKSSFDEEAKISGTVLGVFIEEGDDVPCLETVMIIGSDGEDISGLMPQSSTSAANSGASDSPRHFVPPSLPPSTSLTPPSESEALREATQSASIPAQIGGEIKISPRAKSYAEKARVDFNNAVPTGPNGRIIERDIIELVKNGDRFVGSDNALFFKEGGTRSVTGDFPGAPEKGEVTETAIGDLYTDVKLPNIRKIIAKAMHASLSEMAQLTLNSSFDASAILAFRKKLKDNAQVLGIENITLNDIVLYAVSRVLKNHKDANAHYLADAGIIRYFNTVNLGVAVDTERGLVVPVVSDADRLSLNELAKQTKKTISEAQSGAIDPDKLKGGTFTVTNLGSLGIESFTPVINPPQTCILGVNNITRKIKQVNGQDIFYDCMALSLTFDHRALDGAPAAKFLKELCVTLENFDLLLAK